MKILIAEDDVVSREILHRMLISWGHEVVVTGDGVAAWKVLEQGDAPRLAILDWMMPGFDGPEVCRRTVALKRAESTYLILLTAKNQKEDRIVGLESGANDYVSKPIDRRELKSRVQVGERTVLLQRELAKKEKELERALSQVKQLRGFLPICSYCKKIRDDQNYWHQVEAYVGSRTDARFSHGICPNCYDNIVIPEMAKVGIHLSESVKPKCFCPSIEDSHAFMTP